MIDLTDTELYEVELLSMAESAKHIPRLLAEVRRHRAERSERTDDELGKIESMSRGVGMGRLVTGVIAELRRHRAAAPLHEAAVRLADNVLHCRISANQDIDVYRALKAKEPTP